MSDQQVSVPTAEDEPWGDVEVTFIKTKQAVKIDVSKLTWGDTLEMQRKQAQAEKGEIEDEEVVLFLNSIIERITGEKAVDLPATVVQKVMEVIRRTNSTKTDPN